MSMKPTPGPWLVLPEEDDKPYLRIRGTAPVRRYKIANVMRPHPYCEEDDESRANANLIAAAPDLLAALQTLVVHFRPTIYSPEGDRMLRDARAAINKVIGATS